MDNPKYFITVPFPYMNGRLHIGHAYTISKAEFTARYKKKRGYNVLFPFGFHGTGMPISTAADKIKEEIEENIIGEQTKILNSMGIDDVVPFTDPYYWLKYFPEKCKEDLIQFGVCCDFTKSFTTTNLNPHFDSFIKWQFRKLHQKGLLVMMCKPIIFSIKDNQPCADHDRSIGEGVGIDERILYIHRIDEKTEMVSINSDSTEVDSDVKYPIFEKNGQYIITLVEMERSFPYQQDARHVGYCFGYDIQVKKKGEVRSFKYYEPKEAVISRSKDNCIVAIIEQYHINYMDKKEEVEQELDKMMIYGSREYFANSFLEYWPCTRSKGLGTEFEYYKEGHVIDSLSDSTIYMSFYTIMPYIKNIPIEDLTDEVWDYIFDIKEDCQNSEKYEKMRNEFKYWYPCDMRVSGLDLATNHLMMSIHNHLAVWDGKYKPKGYCINGHIYINGKKMSKSTGNFLILSDAIRKYGVNAIRCIMASAGTGIEIGNFNENDVVIIKNRMNVEREWMKNVKLTDDKSFFDDIFNYQIDEIIVKTTNAYENMNFYKVFMTAFNKLIKNKSNYYSKNKTFNNITFKRYLYVFTNLLEPIIPNYTKEIQEYYQIENSWPKAITHDKSMKYKIHIIDKYSKIINKKICKFIKKNKNTSFNIVVKIATNYDNEIKEKILAYPNILDHIVFNMIKFNLELWPDWIEHYSEEVVTYEYDFISNMIPSIIKHSKLNKIFFEHVPPTKQCQPGNPNVFITKII